MSTGAQARFYHTQAWVRCRNAFMTSRNWLCERCGAPASVAHHIEHITPENVDDPSITLSWDNLMCLCQDCHAIVHSSTPTAEGLAFDKDGNLVAV